jgi:hypothetical protein
LLLNFHGEYEVGVSILAQAYSGFLQRIFLDCQEFYQSLERAQWRWLSSGLAKNKAIESIKL